MSRTGADPAYHKTKSIETVSGRLLGGSGVVSIKDGKGFSVAYSTTGTYVITPDTNYPGLAGGGVVVMSSATAFVARVSAYSVAPGSGNAGSITLKTFVSSSGTATDLGASDELWFSLDFYRTQRP